MKKGYFNGMISIPSTGRIFDGYIAWPFLSLCMILASVAAGHCKSAVMVRGRCIMFPCDINM
jgi:hypothetical protein